MKHLLLGIGLLLLIPECDKGHEMQYYKATCIDHNDHKVCKADEMLIYFNFTGSDNLTEAVIDSLAKDL